MLLFHRKKTWLFNINIEDIILFEVLNDKKTFKKILVSKYSLVWTIFFFFAFLFMNFSQFLFCYCCCWLLLNRINEIHTNPDRYIYFSSQSWLFLMTVYFQIFIYLSNLFVWFSFYYCGDIFLFLQGIGDRERQTKNTSIYIFKNYWDTHPHKIWEVSDTQPPPSLNQTLQSNPFSLPLLFA